MKRIGGLLLVALLGLSGRAYSQTVGSTYQEVGAIQLSDELIKGLAIENALANQAGKNDPTFVPLTDGAYLALRVRDTLIYYAHEHIAVIQQTRIKEGFDNASDVEKAAAAAVLKVDLSVPIPAVPSKEIAGPKK